MVGPAAFARAARLMLSTQALGLVTGAALAAVFATGRAASGR